MSETCETGGNGDFVIGISQSVKMVKHFERFLRL